MASTLGVAALTVASFAGCNSLREDLLRADDPDIISPEAVKSAAGADAVRLGALSRLRDMGPGPGSTSSNGSVWQQAGLLVDEWKSANTFFQHNETDERKVQDNNTVVLAMLRDLYRVRTSAREAINGLNEFKPQPAANVGQMYMALGFAEMTLAENFCNGTPLGDASTGVPIYGPQMTNVQVYNIALAHIDSGLTLSTATDAASVEINRQLRVLKGRVLIDLGRFSEVTAVVSGVPTNFIYNATFALTSGDNGPWSVNTSQKRFVVGDSVDPAGRIVNAIPFASLKDPRVPNDGSSTGTSSQGRGFDNSTNMVNQTLFTRSGAMPYLSGVDARLQEAEVLLRADNFTGMMTILNALRAAPQSLGTITTPAMAALPVPTTKDAAIDLYFREKALWTFSRGQRLPDLRRLVRQYGRTNAQVFPTGTFFKTNQPYGNDMNFPVLREELANPAFTSCTDRNA